MPRLLDLYCGAGGAAVGYSRAGFDDITGVDIAPQPHYPFHFIQADALEYLSAHWQEYDAFHASPVCKGYSIMNNLPWLRGREYPYQILPTREMFQGIAAESGKPWVIENVYAARWGSKVLTERGLEAHGMQAGWLCGLMFRLPLYRHRLFESNFFWMQPGHPTHRRRIFAGSWLAGRARDIVFSDQPAGKGWRKAAAGMGIDWMIRDELTQAIPPVYTEYVGKKMLAYLMERSQ